MSVIQEDNKNIEIKTKIRGVASINYKDGVFKSSQELLNYLKKNTDAIQFVYLIGSSVYLNVKIQDICSDYLIGSIHPKYSAFINQNYYTEIVSYIITGGDLLDPSKPPDIFNKKKYGFNMEIILTPKKTDTQY